MRGLLFAALLLVSAGTPAQMALAEDGCGSALSTAACGDSGKIVVSSSNDGARRKGTGGGAASAIQFIACNADTEAALVALHEAFSALDAGGCAVWTAFCKQTTSSPYGYYAAAIRMERQPD
jgi:hypothetical protein